MDLKNRIKKIENFIDSKEPAINISKDIDSLTPDEVDYFYELIRTKSNFPAPDIDSWNEKQINIEYGRCFE